MPTLQAELNNEFVGKTVTITPSADNKEWTIKVDDVEEPVSAGKDDTPQMEILPTALGTKPYFPSESFTQVKGTDLSSGLVITDSVDEQGNSTGNEYVWIEVPSTYVDTDSTGGPDYSGVTNETEGSVYYYVAIKSALRNYCTKDVSGADFIKNGTSSDGTAGKISTYGYSDTWYNGCGISSSTEYNNLYYTMLTSIYKNGGFWIGRYEAGTMSARGSSSDSIDSLTPLSKQNAYPINYVTCSQAQTIAGRINNIGNYNSSLMFGIQWDLVLRHLSNKGVSTSLLTGDSSTWGNYYNQPFEIKRGKYSQESPWNVYIPYTTETPDKVQVEGNVSTKIGTESSNAILLTTGASDSNIKKNIYDLAGNVLEWTLEKTSRSSGLLCAGRGGYSPYTGSGVPASYRYEGYKSTALYWIGLRLAIY